MRFEKKVRNLLKEKKSPEDLVERLLEKYSLKKLKKKLSAVIIVICNKNIKIIDTKGRGLIRWLAPINIGQSIAYWEEIKKNYPPKVELILNKK